MSLIRSQHIADEIAVMMAAPLQHPGNPETKQQPAAFVVPQFRVAHQPKPYLDAIIGQNQTIAEVIVYYVENTLGQSILPTPELENLHHTIAATEAERDEAIEARNSLYNALVLAQSRIQTLESEAGA